MNLSEALNAALPEIPRNRLARKNPPRLDPDLIIREDVTDGEPIVSVYQRSTANLLRLKPTQWQLAGFFDGVRSYDEIAAAFAADSGSRSPEKRCAPSLKIWMKADSGTRIRRKKTSR